MERTIMLFLPMIPVILNLAQKFGIPVVCILDPINTETCHTGESIKRTGFAGRKTATTSTQPILKQALT
jgi:hypothetical protein